MIKLTSSNYYKSINRLGYFEKKYVEGKRCSFSKGWNYFCGIPYWYNKENIYKGLSKYTMEFHRYMSLSEIKELLFNKYILEVSGDWVFIHCKPYVLINDNKRYFDTNEEAFEFFTTIKGRCVECGNKLYKAL